MLPFGDNRNRDGSSIGKYRDLLGRYLRPQGNSVAVMSVSLLASTVIQIICPRIVRAFIDGITNGVALTELRRLAILFIGMSAASSAMRITADYWTERVSWTATDTLRLDLIDHLLRLDAGFYKAHAPGELIERVDGDIGALSGLLSSLATQLAGSALLLLGIVAALFLEDFRLDLAFAAYATFACMLLIKTRELAGKALRLNREKTAGFYGFLGEALDATEDVRGLGATAFVFKRLFEHLRAWLPISVRSKVAGNLVWCSALAIFAVGEATAYGVGGVMHKTRGLPLGTAYMLVSYAALMSGPLENIRTQLQVLQESEACVTRITSLFAIRSAIIDGTDELPYGPLSVEFRNVSFAYADKTGTNAVLRELSFRLDQGKRLGILGRTGSGKTTIGRLALRMYEPCCGEIILGGVDLSSTAIRDVRSKVAVVTQDVRLLSGTVRDNITFFDKTTPDELLFRTLETLGMKGWLDRLPRGLDTAVSADQMSAGEAQLLALARAFVRDPGLVILDEPSSRLDPDTESLLNKALDRLLSGRTAIIIAHRLATIDRADEIMVLEQGRIVEHWNRTARPRRDP